MKTFQLTIFDGHPIIHSGDDIILIDTGATITIHKTGELNFLDKNFAATTDFMGLTPDSLSGMLGADITTLLATDILSQFNVLFDYAGNELTFSEGPIEFEGEEVMLGNVMGVPVIEAIIEERASKCFLDTGAKISYISEEITDGKQSLGKVQDFYPGVGQFETETYRIDTHIVGHSFPAIFGNLPMLLQMTLGLAGAEGIVGYDLFKQFKVMLDIEGGIMKFNR